MTSAVTGPVNGIILNADDYALTRGISDGILALADAGRISATSAMVNMPRWPEVAGAAVTRRDRIALGLHLNLTYGAPLEPMPRLAPDNVLPPIGFIIRRAFFGRLDRGEVAGEIGRQLDRFVEIAGFAPDFVDGHHHVHALPVVRSALIAEMRKRYPDGPQNGPLLRDPADGLIAIARRRASARKALTVAALAFGFGRAARAAGFLTNDGFAGFSDFGPTPYASEFETYMIAPGSRPMIMCHPGFADSELGDGDSIAARRPQEQMFLAERPGLPRLLWRPHRRADAAEFPW